MELTYSVKISPYRKSGTCELEGFIPLIICDQTRKVQCFAIYDGNNTGNWQRRCATPEEALEYYESCLPKYPETDDPIKQLIRVNGSTAEAVSDNQPNQFSLGGIQ
jgi:hypothetical protein